MRLVNRNKIWAVFRILIPIGCTTPTSQKPTSQTAKQTWTRGVEYAAQGNFSQAKKEFENALKGDPYHDPTKKGLEVIEDVAEQKIKSRTAIHLYRGISYKVKLSNVLNELMIGRS